MRVHFHQLTEPIVPIFDNDHDELFKFALTQSAFLIPTPTQLKSHATRPRRLQATTPRACGDPIRSSH